MDKYGNNITEDRRFEAISILAKTANQMPGKLNDLEKVLKDGGNYEDLLEKADSIKLKHRYFDAPKAASIAEKYENEYGNPGNKEAFDRAHAKVSGNDFDPSTEAKDEDVKVALKAIGGSARIKTDALSDGVLKQGESGPEVKRLQEALNQRGASLPTTGYFGAQTTAAVKDFQREEGLGVDGKAGRDTRTALGIDQPEASVTLPLPGVAPAPSVPGSGMGGSLQEPRERGPFMPDHADHPQHRMLQQIREQTRMREDEGAIRFPDDRAREQFCRYALAACKDNRDELKALYPDKDFSGPLTSKGFTRADHLVIGTGQYAFIIQGGLDKFPLERMTFTMERAMQIPIEQSDQKLERANQEITQQTMLAQQRDLSRGPDESTREGPVR